MTMTGTLKEMFSSTGHNRHGLHGLFISHLKDVYHAEKKILKALPKMARNASSEELRRAFEEHRTQTEGQLERLEQVFEMMDMTPRGKACEAVFGLIAEAEEVIVENEGKVRDAGLLAAGQAVEHYEIARYGSLIAWAREMGHDKAATLLDQTLQEEKQTDALLTRMAENSVNRNAASASAQDNEGDDDMMSGGSSSRSGGGRVASSVRRQ